MKKHENYIFIPSTITKGKDLIILSKDEYDRKIKEASEISEALQVIADGEKEYRDGKTIAASSIKEALKLYGRKSH